MDSSNKTLMDVLDKLELPYLCKAFAKFLNEHEPTLNPVVLLAGAFVNYELSRGEVYLDLNAFFETEETFNDVDITSLKSYFTNWEKEFSKSEKIMSCGDGNSPLVWDNVHNRLYLRRYWTYQKTVDDMIAARLASSRQNLPAEIAEELEPLFKINWHKTAGYLLEEELKKTNTDDVKAICDDIAQKLTFPDKDPKIEPDWKQIASEIEEQLSSLPKKVNCQEITSKVMDKLRSFFVQPDWQKIACAIALRSKFAIITGGPGTGKTTTVTKLLILLVSLMQEKNKDYKPKILLAAPTGKAANRVSESINKALTDLETKKNIKGLIPTKASTIHRLLGSSMSRLKKYNRHNKLNADIVIVDEASMMDLEMMANLLDALSDDTQLILLGDKDQLSSVEPGYVFGNLCKGAEKTVYNKDTLDWISKYANEDITSHANEVSAINQQTVMLKHSYRFDKNSGIGKLAKIFNTRKLECATKIISGNQIFVKYKKDLKKITTLSELKSISLHEDNYGNYLKVIKDRVNYPSDEWAEAVLKAFDKFRILCAIHETELGTDAINKKVQQWLFPNEKSIWFEGRPVMITKNDYNLGLMNGDIGIVLNIADKSDTSKKLKVAFVNTDESDEKIRWFSTSRISDAQTAFSLTVHKSQGSEFEHTLFVLPKDDVKVLTKELYYTAITRAKSKFTLLQCKSTTTTTGEK
jgi:exodeoxyribonuclease V alpha subunit